MKAILTDDFETPLGIIHNCIETDTDNIKEVSPLTFITAAHRIFLQTLNLKDFNIPIAAACETVKCWRWFIDKINNEQEQLVISSKLNNPSSGASFSSSSGEHLDAIEIENEKYHLHIGTEDGEIMQHRAEVNDWMPERFKNEINIGISFTQYIDFGFKTIVPHLHEGEKIYFHFIAASNPIMPSKYYPDERNVSNWLAVEQSKRILDELAEEKFH